MESEKHQDQDRSQEWTGLEGKLEEEDPREIAIASSAVYDVKEAMLAEVQAQVEILNTRYSWSESDRSYAWRATRILADYAVDEDLVDMIIEGKSVPALVKHLQPPPCEESNRDKPFEHEVEKGSAYVLGILAMKHEHQQHIVDNGALVHLVNLLKLPKSKSPSKPIKGVLRRAADAITNLAHENSAIKTRVRMEEGIPPLVELLDFDNSKVQIAAAGALRTLAFGNDENKNQIVECNALPSLIPMLRSEDPTIHRKAVGVIGNLVHSSPNIKKKVLAAGALQPIIGLLSSCCTESQNEAASLLGQFAAIDSDIKVDIVKRGAAGPLIDMLHSPDLQLRETSAFALGRLALDPHNQSLISQKGGLAPLLKLLDYKISSLQHNAAFALYGLVDNEDNLAEFMRVGAVQKLQEGDFMNQATKDVVAKTLKKLEEKTRGRITLATSHKSCL